MTMIRAAKESDISSIIEMLHSSLLASEFDSVSIDRSRASNTIRFCIANQLGCAFLHKDHEVAPPTGVIIGSADKAWYSRGGRIATNYMFYYESVAGGKELVTAFLDWAWSKPAVKEVRLARASRHESLIETAEVFEGCGMSPAGTMYVGFRESEDGAIKRTQARS